MTASTNDRIDRFRESLAKNGADSFFISRPPDITYLSGFTGEGFLIVTPDNVFLLTDFRFTEQAQNEAPQALLIERKKKVSEHIAKSCGELGRLALDGTHTVYKLFAELEERLGAPPVSLNHLVLKLRAVKDDDEVALIRGAARMAETVFKETVPLMKPGMTEKDVADELEYRLRRAGASASPFDTIIASGPNSSRPHHTVSSRKLEPGDTILIDWGAQVQGYASDTTRMLFLEEPSAEQRRVYNAVLQAQQLGLDALGPGKTGVEVDAAARNYLVEAGLGEQFGHGLGHGVGLEVHELPVLSPRSPDVIQPGMVITVEPGVYRSGWGGIRIEDMAAVTDDGCELITSLPKNIESTVVGS